MSSSVNAEVAKLFARLSVEEAVEKEAQLRSAAAQKETQLRRLVAERYRELVECGTVLGQMQQESRRLVAHLELARGVRAREEKRGTEGGGAGLVSSWKLAQTVQKLLQVEQHAWRKVGEKNWLEAAALVRAGMKLLEEHKHVLERVAPVVMRTALAEGRLLAQIEDAANRRLSEAVVLASEEKDALVSLCGRDAELKGRLAAFEKALRSEREDYLALCVALLQESTGRVHGFLEQASGVAKRIGVRKINDVSGAAVLLKSLPPASNAASGREGEDWQTVLLPPLLAETKRAAAAQLSSALKGCEQPEQVSAALRSWRTSSAPLLEERADSPWTHRTAQIVNEAGLSALAELAGRWEADAAAQWRDKPDSREPTALRCALRLQELDKLSSSLNSNSSSSSSVGGISSSSSLSRPARDALLRAQQHQQQMSASACDVWFFGWAHAAVARLVLPSVSVTPVSAAPLHPSPAFFALTVQVGGLLLQCSGFPAWLPSLLAALVSARLAGHLQAPLAALPRFDAQLHLDLLFSDLVFSARPFVRSAISDAAVARLSLSQSSISQESRPILAVANSLLERADPIDAAFARLHSPLLAQQAAARSSALLQPLLLGSSTLPSAASASASSSSSGVFSVARRAPPLRLLPIAGRRSLYQPSSIALPDDDEDAAVSSSAPRANSSSSLLQRLGSQLW